MRRCFQLYLCDSLADNVGLGSNWSAAISSQFGRLLNGLQFFANPGAERLCAANQCLFAIGR